MRAVRDLGLRSRNPRRGSALRLGLLLPSLALAGCDPDAGSRSEPALPPEPSLTLELIRTLSGEELGVGEIGALYVDAEGRIHLADVLSSTQEVVVLSPEGERLRSVGRRGQGPGEFLRLAGIVPDPGGAADSSPTTREPGGSPGSMRPGERRAAGRGKGGPGGGPPSSRPKARSSFGRWST